MKKCLHCEKEIESRSNYCSRKCKDLRWAANNTAEFPCEGCGTIRVDYKHKRVAPLCLTCFNATHAGEQSPTWKGGHRHWAPGRHGRDKDGLSWKVQRQLAWERDNFSCTKCGKKGKRNPDVHHIVPFRISQSHTLGNLQCLCKKCHLTIEATCHEQWGGQLVHSGP